MKRIFTSCFILFFSAPVLAQSNPQCSEFLSSITLAAAHIGILQSAICQQRHQGMQGAYDIGIDAQCFVTLPKQEELANEYKYNSIYTESYITQLATYFLQQDQFYLSNNILQGDIILNWMFTDQATSDTLKLISSPVWRKQNPITMKEFLSSLEQHIQLVNQSIFQQADLCHNIYTKKCDQALTNLFGAYSHIATTSIYPEQFSYDDNDIMKMQLLPQGDIQKHCL